MLAKLVLHVELLSQHWSGYELQQTCHGREIHAHLLIRAFPSTDYTFHHTQKWFDFNFAELQLKYGGPNGRSTIKERIITQHSK